MRRRVSSGQLGETRAASREDRRCLCGSSSETETGWCADGQRVGALQRVQSRGWCQASRHGQGYLGPLGKSRSCAGLVPNRRAELASSPTWSLEQTASVEINSRSGGRANCVFFKSFRPATELRAPAAGVARREEALAAAASHGQARRFHPRAPLCRRRRGDAQAEWEAHPATVRDDMGAARSVSATSVMAGARGGRGGLC